MNDDNNDNDQMMLIPGPEKAPISPAVRNRFTKIAGNLLVELRNLVSWGVDTGNTSQEDLLLTIAERLTREERREAAQKLIDSGMSQRQVAKVFGVDHKTIRNDLARLGNKSPESGDKVPTSSAKTGGAEKKAKRAAIAAQAASGGVTVAPSDKYRIICADPPWSYGNNQPDYFGEQRDHYPTMELHEICAIPVKDWAEDNAVLFLWATSPILEEAFEVVDAWGFQYKAQFVWDKIKHVMGHYNSVRHENLLICIRGSCPLDVTQLFDSVQSIERGKHSVKPVEFYDIIETVYTHGRRLNIFAREQREGWDVYGHIAEIAEAAE